MHHEDRTIGRGFIEALNAGDLDAAAGYISTNFVDHAAPPGTPPGPEGVKMFFSAFRAAFPDLHYVIDDEIAEGDLLVHRTTGHATMQGEFQGMPPTGKHAMWAEIHIGRVRDGKFVEHWANVDQLGMLQQLGVIPSPGQGPD